ncbi:MAG TPA: oxidoreductase [Porticoccaceae bacterium]|jgi:3-oxoacyl-[acyl-carrier protein] reductase|nr:oxidoreductase [Porticoccaceae bacterium]
MSATKNPVAIVTGGSRGVGKATALLLASQEWNVCITCTNSLEDALLVVQQCKDLGVDAIAVVADVSNNQACIDTVTQTVDLWGRVDCLVNNAGTTKFAFNHGDLDALDAADFLHIYSVNVIGPFQMVKLCQPHLLKSANPCVINVSSIAGIKGIGSSIAYAASKGALNTMTLSMARNLGPIRVNCVCPGFVQGDWLKKGLGDENYDSALTNIEKNTPLKLAVTAEQVAEAILNLMTLSNVVTGETLLLDGGFHLTV